MSFTLDGTEVSLLVKAVILWVVGLLTVVPYGIYHLLFQATRDEYALWIVLPLFWVFGYWGVVGPLLAALKVHTVMKAIQTAGSSEELRATLRSAETQDVVIDLIALENHIPRFLASHVYRLLVKRFAEAEQSSRGHERSGPK